MVVLEAMSTTQCVATIWSPNEDTVRIEVKYSAERLIRCAQSDVGEVVRKAEEFAGVDL